MSLFPDPSPAEQLASAFNGRARMGGRVITRQISARIPIHQLIRIDAFAAHSGLPRSQVLARLLEVGIAETWAHLSEETAHAVQQLEPEACEALGAIPSPNDTSEAY